jgi:hypothetical protein
VYVEAALGTLTGVVGSEAIMLVFVRRDAFELVDGDVELRVVCSRFAVGNNEETMRGRSKEYARVVYGNSWKNGLWVGGLVMLLSRLQVLLEARLARLNSWGCRIKSCGI